jgi:hypothetical protein
MNRTWDSMTEARRLARSWSCDRCWVSIRWLKAGSSHGILSPSTQGAGGRSRPSIEAKVGRVTVVRVGRRLLRFPNLEGVVEDPHGLGDL